MSGGSDSTASVRTRLVRARPYLWIVGVSLLTSLLATWPDADRPVPVWAFWDGPSYLTIAKEGYVPKPGNPLAPDPNRPPFYIHHPPATPLTIRALSFVGWTNAVVLASWLAAAGAAVVFFRLCRDVWRLADPLWLTMAFLLLPPRWILYRSVGASEPLFLLLALLAMFFVEKNRWVLAVLASCGLALTRWPGVFISLAWALVLWRRGQWRRILWLAPIPLAILSFLLYAKSVFGDWQAPVENHLDILGRIRILGDVTYLVYWHDNIRGEMVLMLAIFTIVGIWQIRAWMVPAFYCLTQLLFLLFIYGRDWPRFTIAFTPILFALALRDVWSNRVLRWILVPSTALAILWARQAIPANLMKDPGQLLRHLGIAS